MSSVPGLQGESAVQGSHFDLPVADAPDYLQDRGFPADVIGKVGWRVEPIGDRVRHYGLPSEAAEAIAWFIPYRHRNGSVAFERIRLISDADLVRYGGGKYRQPKGRGLSLYDPLGELTQQGPVDALLLVEGEANAVAAGVMSPRLPVIGLPGNQALSRPLADELGHVPAIYLWLDRDDRGASTAAARRARLLRAAGVADVRILPGTAPMDANDVLRELGADDGGRMVQELLDQAELLEPEVDAGDDWPQMHSPRLPEFPVEALPESVARFVEALALETQTPADLGALTCLLVLSAGALGGVVVDCGTWEEELALYVLAVMRSGDRKSTVLKKAIAPLLGIEEEWREAAREPIRRLRTRLEMLNGRKSKLVKRLGEIDDEEERSEVEEQLVALEEELEQIGEPARPRLFADDVTPEAIAGLLSQHGRIAILSAEAAITDNLIGRYDANGAANLHLACKAYTGEPMRIDRRKREPEDLKRPLMTMGLIVQDHVLPRIVGNVVARGQGLAARFAYALPQSKQGHRLIEAPAVSPELRESWASTVRRVCASNPLTQPTEGGFVGSVSTSQIEVLRLSLSPRSKILLSDLQRSVEPRLVAGGDLAPVSDWIARYHGLVARTAALLHLAEHGLQRTVISENTMLRALRIGEYFFAHGLAALSEPDELTRRALTWLASHDESTVSQRDLQRGPLGGRGTAAQAKQLVDSLVAAGALRQVNAVSDSRPAHRPPGPRYEINPRLQEASK
jgi:replicative DNA helicase